MSKESSLSLPFGPSPTSSRPSAAADTVPAATDLDPTSASSPEEEVPLSVAELVTLVGETLKADFSHVLVLGELSSFKRAASGHCYFTLADGEAALDAVIWRSDTARLRFDPQAGDEVVCRGQVSVYAKQGRMQLYVSSMQPVGAGAAQRALEELKKKLAGEGLFGEERKRALPFLPATIGVVTSRHGAALHDILTTIGRRFAHCRIVLSAAAVQGAEAPRELVAALARLERFGECDVVIVGRGGGAAEDLAAFNDERVVRAVADFPVPVVSAVGHEVDYSLCDLAADLRAATPTAAAEAVVPVYAELVEGLASRSSRLHIAAHRYLQGLRHRIGDTAGRLRDPETLVANGRQRTDELAIRLERALVQRHRRSADHLSELHARIDGLGRGYVRALSGAITVLDARLQRAIGVRARDASTRFAQMYSKLDALSPLAVLERGYALATRIDGRLVRSAGEVRVGDRVDLRFHEGSAQASITATTEAGDAQEEDQR